MGCVGAALADASDALIDGWRTPDRRVADAGSTGWNGWSRAPVGSPQVSFVSPNLTSGSPKLTSDSPKLTPGSPVER